MVPGVIDNNDFSYLKRTDGSDISPTITFLNQQGNFYFGAQNIDNDPDDSSIWPVYLYLDEVDISGYTNLEFRVHLAEDDDVNPDTTINEDWDNFNLFGSQNDYVHFNYDLNNTGTYSPLIWVEAEGNAFSASVLPRIDDDFDGVGEGIIITETFSEFIVDIPTVSASSLLDIQIEFRLDKQHEDIAIDNIEIWGITLAEEVDWCNIQFPNTAQQINVGDNFDVYAQTLETGVTDAAGQGAGVEAWIGYNTLNNDPVANDATWTWIPATYNVDDGNNDEYTAEIGSGLAVGTYYYASRFRLNGGPFIYGGTAGIWNNDSVELIVNPHEVDWCNLQFPPSSVINFGDSYNVYGQTYEAGVTDTPASPGAGITAWIGYSTIDAVSSADFTSSDWTWIQANYNPLCGVDCGTPENNDEYFTDLGVVIPGTGTYYYVTRFQLNGGPYTYGGYNGASPLGGFWDGTTNISQILTVNSICASTVTWNGSWSGAADISTEVIIASDCDMTTLPSFSACSLTVNAGATLTIDDSKYVEVNNDIIINGNIVVRSYGSVIQHNENAIVTGSALVEKTTSILNNWYEYTYWSSPVSGETIETALSDSNPNRRFWFDAANFVDATAENNNDNTTNPGQDDIDDDGNDWQLASGIMSPGVGYAATHSEIVFMGAGIPYKYTFIGPFNNGVVNVPVVRNDTEMSDINWNFIGNPYPSAIDVDLFFDKNNYDALLNPTGLLEGVIYLWSQNTLPSDTNNGNEGQNFSNSDYAIINGIGVIPAEDPGGDGITPNRFIPSGQGFFTVFSDNAATTSGNAVFNNSMRVNGNNNQFFRLNSNSQSNKLSIKLTSDNGIFNQLLVGYIDGATNGYDGMFYDAPRNLSTGTAAIIYSTIEGNFRKFAIQGKNPNSLNNDEVIVLGLKNTIEIDTQFTLSLANLEGDFMNTSSIYLRDNLLNIEHDLKATGYTFTSEVGEFQERFEIHFTSTLSTNEFDLQENQLVVTKHEEGLNFETSNQSSIANVQIFDLLGRLIYNVDFINEETANVNTSEMKNAIFIAKVTLANGSVLTKKGLN